jgi:hypothetical protein
MKRFPILFSVIILFCSGCKTDIDHFNEQALRFISDDKKIDKRESEELMNSIKQSDERGFQQFKLEGNKIDHSRVVSYLLKYLTHKKIEISEDDIWQEKRDAKLSENININVFLENSGSMNGYLNDPSTQFKNSVYSLLTRLKLLVNHDSLNLYFINNDDQLMFGNASNNDVEAFKDILNPASFSRISRGRTSETDINELIKRSIRKVNDRNLSVFISDCIYSPGKKRQNASMYLSEQKHGIFLNFATEIRDRNSNLAVIILHLKGGFKGTYYDRQDNKIVFGKIIERPFYIWFIGTNAQIEKIIQSQQLEELDGGYVNKTILQTAKNEVINYKIMSNPLYGTFDRSNLANNIIKKPTLSKGTRNADLFGFTIAVDFSKGIQENNYYLDKSNYIISNNNYKIVIEEVKDKSNPSLLGFSHLLKLQTKEIRDEVLQIKLIGKSPAWVKKYASINDSNIFSDESEQQKTFGLQYLVDGVSEAFYPKSQLNGINKISINIRK